VLHLQEFIGDPLNVLPNLVTVGGTMEQGPQDEHVQGPLEKSGPLLCLFCHRRRSTLNLTMMVDTRLSIVNGLAGLGFSAGFGFSNDGFTQIGHGVLCRRHHA
jgi:hypothetical protein